MEIAVKIKLPKDLADTSLLPAIEKVTKHAWSFSYHINKSDTHISVVMVGDYEDLNRIFDSTNMEVQDHLKRLLKQSHELYSEQYKSGTDWVGDLATGLEQLEEYCTFNDFHPFTRLPLETYDELGKRIVSYMNPQMVLRSIRKTAIGGFYNSSSSITVMGHQVTVKDYLQWLEPSERSVMEPIILDVVERAKDIHAQTKELDKLICTVSTNLFK